MHIILPTIKNTQNNSLSKNYHTDGKKEIQAIIDALRINPVDYINIKDLDSAAKIVKKKIVNPIVFDENNAELFERESKNIRFSLANNSQEIFVSNAKRAVDAIKQEKATPDSVTALRIKHSKKPIDITFQKPPDGRGERRQNRLTTSK